MTYFDHHLFLHASYLPSDKQARQVDYLNSLWGILKRIRFLDCGIEIIGEWIYCFDALNLGSRLYGLGFWFSAKHAAWVFSGGEKENAADDETLDDIRQRLGNAKIT